MTVILPDILSDIEGDKTGMQISNSVGLPRVKLTTKGNRMIGPSSV